MQYLPYIAEYNDCICQSHNHPWLESTDHSARLAPYPRQYCDYHKDHRSTYLDFHFLLSMPLGGLPYRILDPVTPIALRSLPAGPKAELQNVMDMANIYIRLRVNLLET